MHDKIIILCIDVKFIELFSARCPVQIYLRFFKWAYGDGRLIDLWPAIAYRRPMNCPEICTGIFLIGCTG
jgi:hypothetical protein